MMPVAMSISAPEPAVRTDHDDTAPAAPPTGRPLLHRSPPATPSSFYADRRPAARRARDPVPARGERGGDPQRLAPAALGPPDPAVRRAAPHRLPHVVLPRGVSPRFHRGRGGSERGLDGAHVAEVPSGWHRDPRRGRWRGRSSNSSSRRSSLAIDPISNDSSTAGILVPERPRHGRGRPVRTSCRSSSRCTRGARAVVVGVRRRVGTRDRGDRRESRVPRRALVLGRRRQPATRLVLPARCRSGARHPSCRRMPDQSTDAEEQIPEELRRTLAPKAPRLRGRSDRSSRRSCGEHSAEGATTEGQIRP